MLTVAKYLIAALGVALLALLALMALMRRDHKVELVVSYATSPPAKVWRLLTDHAAEPQWLPAFGSVVRQPDVGGREVVRVGRLVHVDEVEVAREHRVQARRLWA